MSINVEAGVQGTVEPGFEPVREVLAAQLSDGRHLGAGVAVYHRGRLVADLWGGVADSSTGRAWERDTMAVCYSTTKGLAATCAHVLAGRELIDYEAPVASYWPEFAQNGKAAITVRQLLSHQAGIPQIPGGMSTRDALDWDKMIRGIEQLEPLWEPGTGSGYHALTFGYLAGELVRRVDGRSVGTFLREEVCGPLGLTDMHIGAPASVEGRIARLESRMQLTPEMEQARAQFMSGSSFIARAMMFPGGGDLNELLNSPEGHAAEIPAVSGIMTARDLARMYACLANYGELDGVRLLPEATVRQASEQQTHAPDKVIVFTIGWALGYMTGGVAVYHRGRLVADLWGGV
ncbi:MAG: serine hydrolase domain-containing protein, partial [Dehalococcoidia bacterium]